MRKNWAALALTGMLCLTTFAGTQTVSAETADSAKQVDIVFTHDTHSHLNTFTTIVDEAEKEAEVRFLGLPGGNLQKYIDNYMLLH